LYAVLVTEQCNLLGTDHTHTDSVLLESFEHLQRYVARQPRIVSVTCDHTQTEFFAPMCELVPGVHCQHDAECANRDMCDCACPRCVRSI
jgi:hypothetical protein